MTEDPTKTPGQVDRNGAPMPQATAGPLVHVEVMRDLADRLRLGIQRYGQPLQPGNGRNALRDVYEELLDAACYVKQRLLEEDDAGSQGETKSTAERLDDVKPGAVPHWHDYLTRQCTHEFPEVHDGKPVKVVSFEDRMELYRHLVEAHGVASGGIRPDSHHAQHARHYDLHVVSYNHVVKRFGYATDRDPTSTRFKKLNDLLTHLAEKHGYVAETLTLDSSDRPLVDLVKNHWQKHHGLTEIPTSAPDQKEKT